MSRGARTPHRPSGPDILPSPGSTAEDVMKRSVQVLSAWLAGVFLAGAWPVSVSAADHPAYPTGTTSATCLQCHDGLVAANMTSPIPASTGTSSLGKSSSDHPVGMDYVSAQTRWWNRLRPIALLPPEIQLVDGRVECSSCHDMSTGSATRLVLEMRGSRLCFGCHNL